jgi:hypothetical protein
MITSLTLGQRLCRNLTVTDLARLPAREMARVMDAINDGLLEYFTALPAHRKNSSPAPTALLPRPASITITVNASGTSITSFVDINDALAAGYSASADFVGHSLIITGDAKINRLMTTSKLQQPHFGTTGTVQATLYGDCIPFGQDDIRLVEPPRYRSASAIYSTALIMPDKDIQQLWMNDSLRDQVNQGDPYYYWTEPLLPVDDLIAPTWLMRVWPLPASKGALTYTLQTFPTALNLEDMIVARNLPIADRELGFLLHLIEERLLSSPIWNPEVDKKIAREDAARARISLASLSQTTHSSGNRVGTPDGF